MILEARNEELWMADPSRPCATRNPEDWFPTEAVQRRVAEQLCADCPLVTKTACLTYALENRIEFGVYGGVTEEDRRLMLKQAAA